VAQVAPAALRAEPAPESNVTTAKLDDEATIVRPRKRAEPLAPTFSVQVQKKIEGDDMATTDVREFFKEEITVGRGSRHSAVDLKLEGDLEVSRLHATLAKNGDEYTVTCRGANPIVINQDREVAAGESVNVKAGDKILVCSYELCIQ